MIFIARRHIKKSGYAIVGILVIYLFVVVLKQFLMNYEVIYQTIPQDKSLESITLTSSNIVGSGDSINTATTTLFEYVEVIDSCGPHYAGACVNIRSGPGVDFPVITKLRSGVVLRVGSHVEHDGQLWYKIIFDEWLRYPERVLGDWFISADFVRTTWNEGNSESTSGLDASSTKRIIVNRSTQKLYAYDGDELFMEADISTGINPTYTPRGKFTIFKKTPSRYMQGPIPLIADEYYDLPGVPWNLYFTHEGAVIHGAYWHNKFGQKYSHGCVNLLPENAKKLYLWADLGMSVTVKD